MQAHRQAGAQLCGVFGQHVDRHFERGRVTQLDEWGAGRQHPFALLHNLEHLAVDWGAHQPWRAGHGARGRARGLQGDAHLSQLVAHGLGFAARGFELFLAQALVQPLGFNLRGRHKPLLGQRLGAPGVGHRLGQRGVGTLDVGLRARHAGFHRADAFALLQPRALVEQRGVGRQHGGDDGLALDAVTLAQREPLHPAGQGHRDHVAVAQPRLAVFLHGALEAALSNLRHLHQLR